MKSKRSTASATVTKNSRKPGHAVSYWAAPDFNRLLDIYWGGSERRITTLTLRILGVNTIALLVFIVGVVYLGQYHNQLIQVRLENFERESRLISLAFIENDFVSEEGNILDEGKYNRFIKSIGLDAGKKVFLFNNEGVLVGKATGPSIKDVSRSYKSFRILTDIIRVLMAWIPGRQELPLFPNVQSRNLEDYPHAKTGLRGKNSLAAWQTHDSRVFLSSTVPLIKEGEISGVLYMTWEGDDIENEVASMSYSLTIIFAFTLLFTIFLSIYLSGAISKPLKKLARAAEKVRKGQGGHYDIPDFSSRRDEIGELSSVLRGMTQALYEQMDSIERFAADVSHELKNPLTSLKSAVETLSVVKSKKDKTKLMEIIEHDIMRLDRLITDISRFSRLDTMLSRESFKELNLSGLLLRVIRLYDTPLARHQECTSSSCRIEYKNISIQYHGENYPVYVWGVEGYIQQVIENILNNALSFVSPGKGEVHIRLSGGKRHAKVEIENNGPHIPEGKLEAIFERFYSHRPDYEEYGQHSGLGLSICKQIIQAHDGEIYAENMPGDNGVRFVIILNAV